MVELFKAPASRLIYVFRINDPAHKGAVKIGEATYNGDLWPNQLSHDQKELRKAARARINQYTQTAGISYDLVWATPAFSLEEGIKFNDKEIHQVLVNSGFKKREFNIDGKATEWIECDPTHVMKAIEAIKQGRKMLNPDETEPAQKPIDFRPEQSKAIKMAVDIFKHGGKRALWNAKMRFGKTLSALEVVKKMQFKRTLILTHRPVVNASWFEDFKKIFFDTGGRWIYGSKAANISFEYVENFAKKAEPNSYVYFASMQDLRGSSKAGGKFDKNNELFATDWDFIIVDEAHEGTQTTLGQNVLEELTKKKTKVLFLSGTPFNIQNEFTDEETFTWDYVMEQEAKRQWEIDHPGDYNPYGTLPAMNIYTYDLGRLMSQKQFADKEVAFNFREFFRTDDDGKFVHEDYVKKFLDLLTTEDKDSLYPFSNKKFRNIFRHTLWMVPGVKEAAALEELLLNHDNFGARGVKIVNVAGDMDVVEDDEERRYNNALTKLREAIGDNPFATETITLSCGRLTTGVSVPEWTGVLMLHGTFNTAASTYMQTIFRVQTPWEFGGLMKENCYVFDFAPDRTLTVLAEVARVNTKPGKADSEQKTRLGEFLNYCSVIAEPGSQMKKIDANRLMERVKKVYIDRVVRSGFEDGGLYNDELLKLSDVDVAEFNRIGKAIGRTKAQKGANEIDVNKQGLDNEQYKKAEEAKKKKPKDRTPEDIAAIEEAKKRREMRQNAISVLRSISIRMPLLIYGADIDDSKEEITIDNFENLCDQASWDEFMPTCEYDEVDTDGRKKKVKRPLSKAEFRRFKKYYDDDIFIAAAKRIRQMVRNADEMLPEQRIARIAEIFTTFRNPDKETVLTPWRVVNMHMGDTLGGYSFYNNDYSKTIDEPRYIDRDPVTSAVFNTDSHLVEINSKTGLYPLYLAYNIYRARIKAMTISPETLEDHQLIWDEAVSNNIFIVCKTKMARSITKRTLMGFRKGTVRTWVPEDLINKVKNQQELFVSKVRNLVGKDVKIKAIVGNPPYQEVDGGGGSSAKPIYDKFVNIASTIKPSYISMIMPSRWMTGGKGLDEFRAKMLVNHNIRVLHDYLDATECFTNVAIEGGICYFLIDTQNEGKCKFVSHTSNGISSVERFLDENDSDVVVRDAGALSILAKVIERTKTYFSDKVLARNPFGVTNDDPTISTIPYEKGLKLFGRFEGGRDIRYLPSSFDLSKGDELLGSWKVFISKADGAAGQLGNPIPARIIGPAVVGDPKTICTETFLAIAPFDSEAEAQNVVTYCKTKFLRFMVGIRKLKNMTRDTYKFVPMQNFTNGGDIEWNSSIENIDAQLYVKYRLTDEEIEFIESMIKPL